MVARGCQVIGRYSVHTWRVLRWRWRGVQGRSIPCTLVRVVALLKGLGSLNAGPCLPQQRKGTC